jgi:hypothetical protein
MPNREDMKPQIRVGDKIVQVGSLDWSGFKTLVEAFAKADLPLPSLADEGLRQKFASVQASAKSLGTLSLADLAGLVYEFIAGNLPTLFQWIVRHPPLVAALVRGASNLTEEEIASLSAGEVLRIARAAYGALVSDGVFTEAAGFFGELLGMRSLAPAASSESSVAPAAADFVSESKLPSPPQPVGA